MKHAKYLLIIILCIFLRAANAEQPDLLSSIHGHWSGKATDGTEISYFFTKDGKVTWYVGEKNFKKAFPSGLVGKYKITTAKPYSEIDISEFKHPIFKDFTYSGILEIIDKKNFRMEGVPSHLKKQTKRPKKFSKAAIIFQKSDNE